MPELRTLQYPNTSDGQKQKLRDLQAHVSRGWKIVSETITPGHIKGTEACCLAAICLPLGFIAGRDPGTINVTLQYDGTDPSALNIAVSADAEYVECPHDWRPHAFIANREYCARRGCNASRIVGTFTPK